MSQAVWAFRLSATEKICKFAVATLPHTIMSISNLTKYVILIVALCFFSQYSAFAADNFTVVIDAGHGGKDTGAIENSVREKDVNLGVALKLAKMLRKKDKDLKVILTRDKDVFLTLQERADIANKAKADLFISIHTNSLDLKNPNRKTVEGASTYTLGLHKDKNNMDVARRENSVMAYEDDYNTKYSGFDPNSDESYIIFEMAQKANLSQSVKFAESVQKQLVSVAGRKDRGVKQAGFWVLWATSMPSVLVELDFVTNPKVAEFIGSDSGQNKLATAICNATVGYFNNLENERKNGRKVRKENTSSASRPSASGDAVTLASSENTTQKKSSAAPSGDSPSSGNVATSRRRRNDKSREKSKNREYEVAVIETERDYVIENVPAEETVEETVSTTPEKSGKDSKSKNKKEKNSGKNKSKNKKETKKSTRVVNGKTVSVGSTAQKTDDKKNRNDVAASGSVKPQKDAKSQSKTRKQKETAQKKSKKYKNSSSAVRLEKKKVTYRIQILASEEHLKSNNPRFCGLSPISCTKSGKLYKYTYGETNDKKEIDRMLIVVKKKIPDAFIVAQ